MTPTVVLIHGGKSTGKKLAAALPGARVRVIAQAIQKAAGGGPGVFLRGYSAAGIEGHRAQQTAVGPAVVAELVTPWLAPSSPPSGGAELAIITAVALAYLWS